MFRCLKEVFHAGYSEHTASAQQTCPRFLMKQSQSRLILLGWTVCSLNRPSALPLWKMTAFWWVSCDSPASIAALFLWSAPDRKEPQVSLTSACLSHKNFDTSGQEVWPPEGAELWERWNERMKPMECAWGLQLSVLAAAGVIPTYQASCVCIDAFILLEETWRFVCFIIHLLQIIMRFCHTCT